jgi:hypothetical protein
MSRPRQVSFPRAHSSNRLARKHVDAVHPVLASCLLLGGCTETIKTRGDTDILEPDLSQIPNELCLRQSAGDSTSPEINVTEGLLRKFHIEDDIG